MFKYFYLLNTRPKKNLFCYLIVIVLVVIIILSFYLKVFESFKSVGIIECEDECFVEFVVPSSKSGFINETTYVSYKQKKYLVNEFYVEDVFLENNIAYMKLKFKCNFRLKRDSFVEFNILYNEQRIIDRIINVLK